jgi:hypothetical protein
MSQKVVAITGAFSYTGKYVAELLLKRNWKIINFTNHPNREHNFTKD